ncbi:glycosyltransferase family 2 protein [Marinobacter orientalis]|uniref:Glycosyltransferase family 2 protein n=1 Tax=Marinobacter orientalis TaxID=1928859 RepID=A0A7Y0RFJ4_9GAMM|nr:glycosyltransferase family 2 protein [Marinobacter orientalis]NMT65300.1 glycosyltransferase family 2 protein [Marinobacter orientalis]TGX47930.1 glycosyltransferase [Marinobacter orientalis]
MKLSVIMTTYNSPEWLEKVLWGYSAQTHKDFELIIGDDGSTEDTREVIDRIREETGMAIKHIWQEDKGFRKCRILNKSILEVESDYVVFTDGDCIPRPDFLEVHAREAEPGRYLSGGYHKLPMSTSKAITKDDIVSGRCFDLKWLKAHGLKSSYKNSKLTATPLRARVFNTLTPTACNFKGSNGSAWLKDIIAVNGFDERMPWGGLDREFGVRLMNSGVKPKHVRYNAIVIHLDHKRGYKDPDLVAANKALRVNSRKQRITRTEHGIEQLTSEAEPNREATL